MRSSLYDGHVVHARLTPRRHRLRYRVFCCLIDLAEIAELDARLRLFSVGRRNLFSFHESDHGDRAGGLAAHIRGLLANVGVGLGEAGRIRLLCYPRILGYAFNPLSTYFCETGEGQLAAIVYEVSNTFGERHSYVMPVIGEPGEPVFQQVEKAMYVSPFSDNDGTYSFHVRPPGETVAVGVLYRCQGEAVMRAHFAGERLALTDAALLRLAVAVPFMTLKVIAGIHWEALRLWLKGLQLRPRVPTGRYGVTFGQGPKP